MSNEVITGTTRVCGLIASPVGHTMSPAMHNAAFRSLGLDYVYVPFLVEPADLPNALDGLRALNISGFNVSIPHKVTCIPFLDGLDSLAEHIGAVNTVVNAGGELRGYNTDAEGFLRSLTSRNITVARRNVVIVGAGGAARAVAYILAREHAYLTLLNRTPAAAETLADMIEDDFGQRVPFFALEEAALEEALEDAHLLVNTTSVGMSPDSGTSPVPARLLRADLTVCDIVYNPVKTALLAAAEAAGAVTVSGADMLAWQGALAFQLWTGVTAPFELMRDTVLDLLRGHED
jgi:shikimate dehydrogenase